MNNSFCNKCGCPIDENDIFCKKCGSQVEATQATNSVKAIYINRDQIKPFAIISVILLIAIIAFISAGFSAMKSEKYNDLMTDIEYYSEQIDFYTEQAQEYEDLADESRADYGDNFLSGLAAALVQQCEDRADESRDFAKSYKAQKKDAEKAANKIEFSRIIYFIVAAILIFAEVYVLILFLGGKLKRNKSDG